MGKNYVMYGTMYGIRQGTRVTLAALRKLCGERGLSDTLHVRSYGIYDALGMVAVNISSL